MIRAKKNVYYVTYKSADKIKSHILQVKCLLKIIFTQMWHNTSLCKRIQIFVSDLYEWRCFSFIVLRTLPHFILNQTTNKAHNTEKSVRVNEIVLLQVNIYQY